RSVVTQPLRHFLEQPAFVVRQAADAALGNLVEYEIELLRLFLAHLAGERRTERLAFGHERVAARNDLVHFVGPLARTRLRTWNRARRLVVDVGYLRHALAKPVDAARAARRTVVRRGDAQVEIADEQSAQVRHVRDARVTTIERHHALNHRDPD